MINTKSHNYDRMDDQHKISQLRQNGSVCMINTKSHKRLTYPTWGVFLLVLLLSRKMTKDVKMYVEGHPCHTGTHLLARCSLGVMPYSPNRVTNTLASVPAPLTSPVMVTTSYTARGTSPQTQGDSERLTTTDTHTGGQRERQRERKGGEERKKERVSERLHPRHHGCPGGLGPGVPGAGPSALGGGSGSGHAAHLAAVLLVLQDRPPQLRSQAGETPGR